MYRFFVSLSVLFLALSAQAETFEFTFDPPDSVAFSSTTISVRYRVTNDNRGPVDTTRVTANHYLHATDSGYTIDILPGSVTTTRSGEEADNPIMQAVGMSEVSLYLDSTGRAVSAGGFDGLLDRIDSLADSATSAAAHEALDPEALAASQVNEWNSRLLLLSQLSMDVGDVLYEQAQHELPRIGRLDFFTATEFVDTFRVDGRLAGEVRITSNSDPETFGGLTGLTLEEVQGEFNIPDSLLQFYIGKGGHVTSVVDMTFDLETLLPIAETGEQRVFVSGAPQGAEPQVMEMIDRQEKSYEYPGWSQE